MPPATPRRSSRLAQQQKQEQEQQQQQKRRTSAPRARRMVASSADGSPLPQRSSGASPAPRRAFLLSGLELATFATVVAYCLFVLFREGDRLCKAVLRELPRPVLARAGLRPVPSVAAAGGGAASLSATVERLLSFGSGVNDLSDAQWRDFRGSAPLLAAVLAGFVLLSRAARAWDDRPSAALASAAPTPSLRLGARTRLLALLGVAFLIILHGSAAPFPLFLALASLFVADKCAGRERWGLWAVWAWHAGVFLVVRATEGLPYAALPLGLGPLLAPLDALRGPLRWHIHYNLMLLRMVSHAADLHWARLAAKVGSTQQQLDRAAAGAAAAVAAGLPLTRRRRRALERAAAERHLPAAAYASPALYLAYCLYPPLYIAGPIATFNALAAQILPEQGGGGGERGAESGGGGNGNSGRSRSSSSAQQPVVVASPLPLPTPREIILYALRALACWLVLELVTHRLFFWAVARARLWQRLATVRAASTAAAGAGAALSDPFLPPLQMALVPWWVMLFAWLKFLALWRFFRAFALADGASAAPENLTRCICNNYDVAGFWQNWHASYNRWLVRYMYVPLGGARTRLFNVWPIFTFVAIWHDLEIKMLWWAWLMCLLIAPEILAKKIAHRPQWPFPDKRARSFRYVCAAAGAANVVLLMAANMVGFVFGSLEGAGTFLRRVVADAAFGPVVAGAFFCGVQLMMALRDWEAWKEEREREEDQEALEGTRGQRGRKRNGGVSGGGGGGSLAMAALGRRRGGGGGASDEEEEQDAPLLLSVKAGGGGGGGGGGRGTGGGGGRSDAV